MRSQYLEYLMMRTISLKMGLDKVFLNYFLHFLLFLRRAVVSKSNVEADELEYYVDDDELIITDWHVYCLKHLPLTRSSA